MLFPWLSKKLLHLPNFELNNLFPGSVQTRKSMNVVYKTNIDCSFIQGMVEKYCTPGKIQPSPIIHLGTIIFHHSTHEQSISVYYLCLTFLVTTSCMKTVSKSALAINIGCIFCNSFVIIDPRKQYYSAVVIKRHIDGSLVIKRIGCLFCHSSFVIKRQTIGCLFCHSDPVIKRQKIGCLFCHSALCDWKADNWLPFLL